MYLSETNNKGETEKFILLFTFLTLFISVNIVWGVPTDTVKVIAKNTDIAANSIYEVYFSIAQEIPPKAIIVITFPESFDLSGVKVAGSTTINGGFEVYVEDLKVILQRSGLGRIIKPYEKVNVRFANVRNPSNPNENYKINVKIKNENEITILEKEEAMKIISQSQK